MTSKRMKCIRRPQNHAKARMLWFFSDYTVERNYAMQDLRVAKELGADKQDWEKFIED